MNVSPVIFLRFKIAIYCIICYSGLSFCDSIYKSHYKTKQTLIMKTIVSHCFLLIAIALLTGYASMAQKANETNSSTQADTTMKTYLIERNIPNAGNLTQDELKTISQKSCSVLREMGPKIQWIQSYVVGDKIFVCTKRRTKNCLESMG